MKKINLSLILICISISTFAQNVIKASYKYPLTGNVESMEVAAGGMLLVGSSEGLTAIEAHKNEVAYQYNTLGKIKPEEMTIISNTPYVILTRGYTKVILDYSTGKELFNSLKSNWTSVIYVNPDFESNTIYMMGTTAAGYTLGAYNLETFESKGLVTFADKKTMGAYVNTSIYYESAGKLFVRTEKGIVCVDKNMMKITWVYDNLEKTSSAIAVMANPKEALYFICESNGKDSYLHKIDANGKLATKKPIKLGTTTQQMFFTSNGLFIRTADVKTNYIQLYDVNTGMAIWKKPFEIDGFLYKVQDTKNGVFMASQNGMMNMLDLTTGKTILKKDIKTGPNFKYIELLENENVFYITNANMGIANTKTGEFVKEPIKFKKVTNMITAYDEKNENVVVSTGTELYFIKNNGESKKITDVKFKEDETPTKIEFRASGILISASQNAMLVTYDGVVKYESYYKAPGQSIAAKVALGALAASTAQSNQSMMDRGYKGNGSATAGLEGEMGKRFKATATTKDHLFILTKLEDGIGLLKLNKDTGKKDAELVLKDKKPDYKVDDNSGVLYYKKDKKTIIGYDLRN